MFNAIKYTQELEKAGFSRDQAEASVNVLINIMDQNLATKIDLKELSSELLKMEISMKSELRDVATTLRSEMKDLHYKMITTLGSLMAALFGIGIAIMKIH